jgi:acetoin utilization protein AcuC
MSSAGGVCDAAASVVFDPTLTEYDFGPQHPMSPVRVDLTMRLAEQLGVLKSLRTVPAPMADDDLIATVHEPALIEAVTRMGLRPGPGEEGRGLGTDDNPVFTGMHQAAAHVVGASWEAFRQVWSGESGHSVNIAGGLHHAMRDRASGFCIYNDVAIGIQWLLDHGAERVAYVDVDVHHGDGVERIFWDDPRVLTISLHESGQFLFPGTGFAEDTGGPDAEGAAVNVALPPGTGDAGWLRAFHAVVPPLVREFAPDILVTQQGCDSHADDPLADLQLSVDGQRAAYQALHGLAHEVCDGRWVATGGGGYALVRVVPRAWTHLLATVAGHPLDPELPTPGAWIEHVRDRLGVQGPTRLTDGREPAYRPWEEGYDPASWLDRQVNSTRTVVFPLHGLDPLP